jgi:drug/metabolite transporter (DMT)-like permease
MTARPHRPILAIALRLAAAVLLAVMFALVKLAGERGANLAEILLWRQGVAIPCLLGWMLVTRRADLLRTNRLWVHGRRALLGLSSMTLLFGATALLPLAELTTLTFVGPLFAVILSAVLLRERVGQWRWGAVALGFVGVAIVAQPSGQALPAAGVAMASCAALLNGLITVQVRDLGRTEHPLTTVLLFSAFSTVVLLPLMLVYGQAHPPVVWLMLLGCGVFGFLGQIGLTGALRYGAVASVTVMDYTSLIWTTLAGWLVWNHLPPATTWLGAPLIIAAGLVVLWREHRLAIERARAVTA